MPVRGSLLSFRRCVCCFMLALVALECGSLWAQPPRGDEEPTRQDELSREKTYQHQILPLLRHYCSECHSDELAEAEVNLVAFPTLTHAQHQPNLWLRVRQMLESGQMPPPDSTQLDDAARTILRTWVHEFLTREAEAYAGDPGNVVLRRLNNAEYNYTIQDLTGISSLDPTKEFPVDGGAGEGFTNTGNGLSMSPSLITKYLDAAKQVAEHVVLLPDGIRFSEFTTRRDRTDELLSRIQAFYREFTDEGGGSSVNLQGIEFTTNQGGNLPLSRYLAATFDEFPTLMNGAKSIEDVANARQLNAKYLNTLWQMFTVDPPKPASILNYSLQQQWTTISTQTAELPEIATERRKQFQSQIERWQKSLWKFNTIGQLGREGGATRWLEPVQPMVQEQEIRLKLPEPTSGQEVVVFLVADDAGDGNTGDVVRWIEPRLEGGDRPTMFLRDALGWHDRLIKLRRQMLAQIEDYLGLAEQIDAAYQRGTTSLNIVELAQSRGLDHRLLEQWLRYLEIGPPGRVTITGHFDQPLRNQGNYPFVNGWGVPETPLILANASDQEVRIPGISAPRSIVVHPAPTSFVAIGWQSPIRADLRITGRVKDAHPECGNGITWQLQHRTRIRSTQLGAGELSTGGSAEWPVASASVQPGDVVSLLVGPRNGDHGCDLTRVEFEIQEVGGEERVWNLSQDVADTILDANPHPDRYGNAATWHFYRGDLAEASATSESFPTIPPQSTLSVWKQNRSPQLRWALGEKLRKLADGVQETAHTRPDRELWQQLQNFPIPVDHPELSSETAADPRFGRTLSGEAIASTDLAALAPSAIEFRLPAEIARGRDLVVRGTLLTPNETGSVQLQVMTESPQDRSVHPELPFVVHPGGQAEKRLIQSLDAFREIFPPVLCYARIVPVDETVTMLLFYREDDMLQRLMLNEQQTRQLERLWDELFFISQEPLQLQVSFEQLKEFATQDRPDLVEAFKTLNQPIQNRADAFRQRLLDTEPLQLQGVIQWADRIWRRPLADAERQEIQNLYSELRKTEVPHETAIRLTLVRLLTSPTFLYRRELPPHGKMPGPVSNWELANRLSYFLWSSMPDDELRQVARDGRLVQTDVLVEQTRRMLADPRSRRLAIEFACQWLHVRDFDQNDEKNEQLFPEFAELRKSMYEETVLFFDDMFRHQGSILDLLNADHTFLNEALAQHYGIPDVKGPEFRRVAKVRDQGRGGILGMATILASQSGASRTSPILRGNWVSETLLNERIPKPPANVPQLPDVVPTGLTEREMIELHSSAPACAKCHIRIDPYGFALEQYDPIGRRRNEPMKTTSTLRDGTSIDGLEGLRDYLTHDRQADVVRQFCRKLLGYSLGREVQFSDEPLLAAMQRRLATDGYRFQAAVETLVTSPQFLQIRGADFEINE